MGIHRWKLIRLTITAITFLCSSFNTFLLGWNGATYTEHIISPLRMRTVFIDCIQQNNTINSCIHCYPTTGCHELPYYNPIHNTHNPINPINPITNITNKPCDINDWKTVDASSCYDIGLPDNTKDPTVPSVLTMFALYMIGSIGIWFVVYNEPLYFIVANYTLLTNSMISMAINIYAYLTLYNTFMVVMLWTNLTSSICCCLFVDYRYSQPRHIAICLYNPDKHKIIKHNRKSYVMPMIIMPPNMTTVITN
jgi:hypothetical protein